MDLLYINVTNVTHLEWQHFVYGYVDFEPDSLSTELRCFKQCHTEETDCHMFAVEDQRCYFGRRTHSGGTLTGTTSPDSWTVYVNQG